MTACEHALNRLHSFLSRGFVCTGAEAGYEVLVTPALYPDSDNIELFLKPTNDGKFLVSDLGQTMAKLSSYGFSPRNAPSRRAMIHQIVASMGVEYDNGIVLTVSDDASLGERVWDLMAALQRLSDLAFTVPGYTRHTFNDDFENYVVSQEMPYKRAVRMPLPTGQDILMDFIVRDTKLVHLLSAGSPGYAREARNRVYTNFSELQYGGDDRARIAVIDDRRDVWVPADIETLGHVSQVYQWSRRDRIEEALRAA